MLDLIYYLLFIYLCIQSIFFFTSTKNFRISTNSLNKGNNVINTRQLYNKRYNLNFFVITLLTITIISFIITFLQTNTLSYLIHKNSNILQFFFFKLSNFWNNHEGSFLLICLLLIIFKQITIISSTLIPSHSKKEQLLYSLSFLEIFFFVILILVNNPFLILEKLKFKQIELNPILQDWLLLIHPPILYIGYIGISILWFYSIFQENSKININKFLFWIWSILTLGILLGSFWAYHELGWGGWWFWDPVENISLIPWLWLTLSFHIKNIWARQMIFGIAFFGNILGTFIIRAGFLNSVHSFVNDDNKTFFLISLLMNLFIFLVIFSQQNYKKEATFIKKKLDIQINNIFFCLVLILIILGTFLPIFFSFDSIIKPSYFNNLLIPLCFIFTWWFLSLNQSKNNLIFFLFSFFFCLLLNFNLNFCKFSFYIIIICFFGSIFSAYLNFFSNKSKFFFQLLHLNWIALFLLLLLDNYLSLDFLKIIKPGDIINIQNYKLYFRNVHFNIFSNYNSNFANFLITDNISNTINFSNFFSEKRFYYLSNVYTSKNNIKSNWVVDIHCFLNSGNIFDGWLFKISYKPFVIYFWLLVISNLFYSYWFLFMYKKNEVIFLNSKYFVIKYFEYKKLPV